jgi:two-component system OmpR family response regulator
MKPAPARILVIDDDEVVTETFARMLRLQGHDVETAPSAELGLTAADRHPPDAIILDLRMPLINGLGFLYRLRKRPHNSRTPVAIVTGDYFLGDDVLREISELGAELHYKPLWLEELVAVADTLIGRVRACAADRTLHAL